MRPGDRVRIATASLGTVRAYAPLRFTEMTPDVGEEGVLVDVAEVYGSAAPEGWVLVKLDEPDSEPDHPASDGHLYCPVDPSMIEAID